MQPQFSEDDAQRMAGQFSQADYFLSHGQSNHALSLYEDILEEAPWCIPAYCGASAAALDTRLFRYATEIAVQGLDLLDGAPLTESGEHPIHEEVLKSKTLLLTYKASGLAGQGQNEEAIRLLRECYELRPSGSVLIELGNVFALSGQLDEAEQYYSEGLLETDSPDMAMISYNNMAILLENRGDYDMALKYFRRGCVTSPMDSMARIELATALVERGLFDDAAAQLQTVRSNDHRYVQARQSLRLIKKYRVAHQTVVPLIDALEREIEREPKAALYLELANHYLETGQNITAIRILEKGLALEPDNLLLLTLLSQSLISKRLFETAVPLIDRAIALEPDHVGLWALRTMALAFTHQPVQAAVAFDKAMTFLTTAIRADVALKVVEQLTNAGCVIKAWPLIVRALFRALDIVIFNASSEARAYAVNIVDIPSNAVLEEQNERALGLAASLQVDKDVTGTAPETASDLIFLLAQLDFLFLALTRSQFGPLDDTLTAIRESFPESDEILMEGLAEESLSDELMAIASGSFDFDAFRQTSAGSKDQRKRCGPVADQQLKKKKRKKTNKKAGGQD